MPSPQFDTEDQKERENELAEISRTFDKYRGSDFGRKLYLIQNSIYGVISSPSPRRLPSCASFISLTIEQQPSNDPGTTTGIKPLPNLETRFVAANTLMGIEKPLQTALGRTNDVIRLETELAANRERYFHANTRSTKLACREQDDILRKQLAAALQTAGFPADSATQVAAWDPFDQNRKRRQMVRRRVYVRCDGGFDVAIGNPPYVRADSGDQHLKLRREIENSNQYETLWKNGICTLPSWKRSYKLLKERWIRDVDYFRRLLPCKIRSKVT